MNASAPRRDQDVNPVLTQPWAAEPELVLRELKSSREQGLSKDEAQRRLHHYGPNRLREARQASAWLILWNQFRSMIVALLATASVVAFAFGEHLEGAAIVAVIFINAAIGFVTELRALRSMDALRALGHSEARVRRDGRVQLVPASLLVPGDLIVLDAGDVLTADARLVSGSRFQVDESPLTGESLPIEKDVPPVAADSALSERTSIVYKGTAVTRGSGEAVVVATGMATELGLISTLVVDSDSDITPLERRLDQLGRRLIGLTLVVATLVAVAVVVSGRDLVLAVEIGIALAVATVPEGLPIVATVALARGMWRMARRNALVERLSAVETLGAATLILTDKTGTLTENRMTIVEFRIDAGRVDVSGTGLETTGRFELEGESLSLTDCPELRDALRIAVLCNNATLDRSDEGENEVMGDPTEIALLVAGAKAGLERTPLEDDFPRISEFAFDPEAKRMATLHDFDGGVDGGVEGGVGENADGGVVAAAKGAPEAILEICAAVRSGGSSKALGPAERKAWLGVAEEMAARGERVLALAMARVESVSAFRFENLELVGLVGFFDPPRERVREAVEACDDAGIRVVMVTGDHLATASTVAEAVGLLRGVDSADRSVFVDARKLPLLETLSEGEVELLLAARVIARATPKQKLELIEMHQRAGAIVAMTGDGVNDAPALKKADIGVAMGLRGTQVAREAADIVLQDDELGTIVAAIDQGRAIFANIRKFVVYLMSCNVSEIFAVALGVLAQGPLPILPLQILFLNLVTDVFPALALGVGEGSSALMRHPPRDPGEPILARRHWRTIFILGAVMALSVLGALAIAVFGLKLEGRQATTIAFLTLAMAQLWHVFSMRNVDSGWIRNEITQNPWIWAALGLCLSLIVAAVYWPMLANVLSIEAPGVSGWTVAVLMSLVPFAYGQLSMAPFFNPARRDLAAAGSRQEAGIES